MAKCAKKPIFFIHLTLGARFARMMTLGYFSPLLAAPRHFPNHHMLRTVMHGQPAKVLRPNDVRRALAVVAKARHGARNKT